MNKTVLKGRNFILRPYKKGDEFFIVKNANNKKIAKNMFNGFPNPYFIPHAKKWVNSQIKNIKKNSNILEFVIDIDGEVIGAIGGSIKNNISSFGYWLGEKYWGQGIMSEAVKIYIKYLFNVLKVKKVTANVFKWNKGSQRVLEKNAFKLEGVLRKQYLKDGVMVDEYCYGKLKNDR